MQQNSTNSESRQNTGFQFYINYKLLLQDALKYWWLFVVSLFVSLAVIYFVLRYSIPMYQASSSILIEEKPSSAPVQENMMEGFGLTPGMRSVDNQIAILTSWDVVFEAVKRLDFALSYYVEGSVKTTEMYNSSPFTVIFDSLHCQLIDIPIHIESIDKERFRLIIKGDNSASTYIYKTQKNGITTNSISYDKIHSVGEIIETPYLKFIVTFNSSMIGSNQNMHIIFRSFESIANQLKSNLRVYRKDQTSSIVRLSTLGTNSEKNIRFLDTVASVFIESNLARKNQIALNTIQFIEVQLGAIADSLRVTGSELSQFRTENNLLSVESKGEQLYVKLEDENKNLAELMLVRNYYDYLREYFSKGELSSEVIAPAIFKIDNLILTNSINEIITINSKILVAKDQAGGGKNPFEKDLLAQREVIRQTMLKGIDNQRKALDQNIDSLFVLLNNLQSTLVALPETERKFIWIQRKFELNNEVFTFLLRKRSESQIQKASNTPDHQVLERASYAGQISPTPSNDYKNGFIVGLIIPVLLLVFKQLINNKISSSEDIQRLTNIPIVGHVIHSAKKESLVVFNYPKSVVTETFRRIRTRMEFMIGTIQTPIIAISSSIPSEGKTFCALNIASAFALAGKKTVLCGFDLRKPGLNSILGLSEKTGISNFLVSQTAFEDTFVDIGQKNLTVIPSGHIPPNPAELISSAKCKDFFELLKSNFEIIILDTPPMGIVSDTFILARHADSLIFITRQKYSIREAVVATLGNIQAEGIKNIGIVLNDVDIEKGAGRYSNYAYHYGSGYGYGYTYGYYEE